MSNIEDFSDSERTIGKGIAVVDSLPFEAPWLSPYGACLINITAIRRNKKGVVKFQLGDENGKPYEDGTAWVKANRFFSEWPD